MEEVSVQLTDGDVEFLDIVVEELGDRDRSAVIRQALGILREEMQKNGSFILRIAKPYPDDARNVDWRQWFLNGA